MKASIYILKAKPELSCTYVVVVDSRGIASSVLITKVVPSFEGCPHYGGYHQIPFEFYETIIMCKNIEILGWVIDSNPLARTLVPVTLTPVNRIIIFLVLV